MRNFIVIVICLMLSSCVVYDAWDRCETLRKGDELRFTFPQAEIEREIKVERTHLPTVCREFYNDGTGRWAECMGVGPK